MTAKHGLGRGLKALISEAPSANEPTGAAGGDAGVLTVPLEQVARSALQPRRRFSEEGMEDLVRSVKERGVVQPLLVRRKENGYELIAGERRFRAARDAGLGEVPVIVIEASDQDTLELALIENLQREDLNPIEEALGYKTLADRFGMTQEQISGRVGKSRASVANAVRLLDLSEQVRECVEDGRLSPGHAKVLLGLDIPEERAPLARQAMDEGLSVRELEKLVEKKKRAPRRPRAMRDDIAAGYVTHMVDTLRRHFGTSVKVIPCRTLANGKKARGCVEIDFYSVDEFDRILQMLGVSEEGGEHSAPA